MAPWQLVFWALTGFGLLMLACSVFVVPETLPPERRHRGAGALVNARLVNRTEPGTILRVAIVVACAQFLSAAS
ncbi:MAG: Bcr/CflA family efflux transporter [Microbacteriaceae bacterium]|nr:Bcr/CflA family efflux transporter [Microbacteriaceae bacterium]